MPQTRRLFHQRKFNAELAGPWESSDCRSCSRYECTNRVVLYGHWHGPATGFRSPSHYRELMIAFGGEPIDHQGLLYLPIRSLSFHSSRSEPLPSTFSVYRDSACCRFQSLVSVFHSPSSWAVGRSFSTSISSPYAAGPDGFRHRTYACTPSSQQRHPGETNSIS